MSNFALSILFTATIETLYMVFIASFLGIVVGLIIGTILFVTSKHQSNHVILNRFAGFIVNITRSTPFVILMIGIIPFTRWLVGTSIGINAAVVPLSITAAAFFARVTENALAEVPAGLIETSRALGMTTWQFIIKVLIPESTPTLIRGATLTIIGLIGYSAMAGVVGGGGLGELAINYGYERFDVIVMLETVIILIVLVQLIQWIGDHLAKQHHIKYVIIASIVIVFASFGWQWFASNAPSSNTIKVGVMSGWPEEVMQVAQAESEKRYHLHIKIVPFTDYVQPNIALADHDIDANIFQHLPYLQAQIAAHHFPLIAVAKTFVYPMGFYSNKIKTISALPDHALVAIPNDPSNSARALLLLQQYHLITLKPNVSTLATVQDIISNPYHLRFTLLDAAALPRVLKDADLVAITNDFIKPAGLTLNEALLKEGSNSPYANIIVVRQADKDKLFVKDLIAVMHSQAVLQTTEHLFPDGAAIPAW